MVDERALKDAVVAFGVRGQIHPVDMLHVQGLRAAIEAYEAAKWRPIEEAPECADWFLIAWPNSDYPPQSLRRGPNPGVWMSTDSGVWYESTLRDNGAMFRTIDPPTQDAVSCHSPGPPAADAKQEVK